MEYVQMEKLGVKVSRLGFGCMRLPVTAEGAIDEPRAAKMLDRAYKAGVNYFDTAYFYHNRTSEAFVGRALKAYPRESFYLATKLPLSIIGSRQEAEEIFNGQFKTMQVEYFDFYLLHCITESNWKKVKEFGLIDFLLEQQKAGRIRHLGFSFHDTEPLLKEVVASNKWDFVQLQLNYLDWKAMHADRLYQVLVDNNLPCMVMEPVRGGYLANLNDEFNAKLKALDPDASIASWAVRFVSGLDNVAVVLSGMTLDDQLEDNVKTLGNFKPLSEKELSVLDEITEELCKLNDIPCTGCRYCMDCPKGVDIPEVFNVYAQWRVFGNSQRFVNSYENALNHNKGAVNCVKCGLCAKQCPQHIDIPNQLARVHSLYLEEKAKLEAEKAAAEA